MRKSAKSTGKKKSLIAQGEISRSVASPTHVWKMPNIYKKNNFVPFSTHVSLFPYICVKIQTCEEESTQV